MLDENYYITFDCDKEAHPCCKTDWKHDFFTMKIYDAKGPNDKDFRKVRFCDDHYKNHVEYGWVVAKPIDSTIVNIKAIVKDGYHCKSCNEYCQFSAPNQSDGTTFICYGCRNR